MLSADRIRATCMPLAVVVSCLLPAGAVSGQKARGRDAAAPAGAASWWAFRPVREPAVPAATGHAVDAFVRSRLRAAGLEPSAPAGRVELARRVYFDLLGVPPSSAEVDAFVADEAPGGYERLIDRLLADPRYGERQAQAWLDLVRYADSDGFKSDHFRPDAWRYRDYVVRAFNADKPYDRFILEQLAGDEVDLDDPDVVVATGYLRHGQYEHNQRDVHKQRQDILDDLTEVTADVFLGLSLGCARCHDHKADPIRRVDYYRLQAFFAPVLWRDDRALAGPDEVAAFAAREAQWAGRTTAIRDRIEAIEKPHREAITRSVLAKFTPELQAVVDKPAAARSPLEVQLAYFVTRQYDSEGGSVTARIKGAEKKQWSAERERLAAYDAPPALPRAFIATDVGPVAPATKVPGTDRAVEPGFPPALGPWSCEITPVGARSTGRRTALARWLGDPAHPLTARVMVNRIWRQHFGRGLVATPSDFGKLGERPTHPELLDWLAARFVASGFSIKALHRLILTSATYRQSALGAAPAAARRVDPDNRLLWRMDTRRLDAEQIRDAMLATSGELDPATGGPPVEKDVPRRAIYLRWMRNTPDPVLAAFDAPVRFTCTCERSTTTSPTQALLLVNSAWALERARVFARRVLAPPDATSEQRVHRAYRLAFGRPPAAEELAAAVSFVARGAEPAAAWTDLCRALLNANEFVYVD